MIAAVCLQYLLCILAQLFCPLKYEMCYSTTSSLHTVSFNLTNGYLFTGDVEPVNLSNLEVLNLSGNQLNGSLLFKGKHSYHLF